MKKLAVVIGAGRGMGNHIAEHFAKENFRVVLGARRQKFLDEYAAELNAKGYEVFARAADVSDTESLTKLFDEVQKKFRRGRRADLQRGVHERRARGGNFCGGVCRTFQS